jgi:hypothetical protein
MSYLTFGPGMDPGLADFRVNFLVNVRAEQVINVKL